MGERRTVKANGVRLSCYVGGEPDAPPIVFLHGLGDGAKSWSDVLPAFEPDFRVVVPDLRGHGDSDWPGEYSFGGMRDDVLAVADVLGYERFSLVGHSMGGMIALLVAEQHPQWVDRLVVEDAAPCYPGIDRPIPDEPPDEPLPFDWPLVAAVLTQVNDPDPCFWDDLGEITAPTLFVGGGPDSAVDQEKIKEAAALIADARVVTIPAGHNVHETRPEEFSAVVLDWWASRAQPA